MKSHKTLRGFTLIEMVLVMVIISIIIVITIGYLQQRTLNTRIDRTAAQMQQILNAGLSYYISNGEWPANLDCLKGQGGNFCKQQYLPLYLTSPWAQNYTALPGNGTPPALFYVFTQVTSASGSGSAAAIANIIAGKLPLAYTTATAPSSADDIPPNDRTCTSVSASGGAVQHNACYVVSAVNIPGQNLNNASAVNFAGVYHNGACVPVPSCPVDQQHGNTMTPEIMVSAVSISGVNEMEKSTGKPNIYPISSFTAYATAPVDLSSGSGPAACSSDVVSSPSTACYVDQQGGQPITSGKYWRVCMQVITEKGPVQWNSGSDTDANNWGKYATIMAVTRCSIKNEPSGSSFNVWAP